MNIYEVVGRRMADAYTAPVDRWLDGLTDVVKDRGGNPMNNCDPCESCGHCHSCGRYMTEPADSPFLCRFQVGSVRYTFLRTSGTTEDQGGDQ